MPRRMPPLAAKLGVAIDNSLELAEMGERIRALSPLGSVARRELRSSRIEAFYETAYLRVFLLWEDFLEQSFLRYVCGHSATSGVANLRQSIFPSLLAAATAVLGTRDYVSWANPSAVIGRSQRFIASGNHELVLNSNLARLEAFHDVRNRIAHRSEYARKQFDLATVFLTGRRFPGSSAGRFLRQVVAAVPAPESWLRQISTELKLLALQVCP
jgi:hypothetical protein